jgi:hypothetical protein
MEVKHILPPPWDHELCMYPQHFDPIFDDYAPVFFYSEHSISSYPFRVANAIVATKRAVHQHPRIEAAFLNSRHFIESVAPGRING